MAPWIDMGNGAAAHVCIRGQRSKRCKFCCNREASKLCDFPVGPRAKTCDAEMCDRCATCVGPDQDFCPKHKDAPVPQASLFGGAL
jgi:hypothetical protein